MSSRRWQLRIQDILVAIAEIQQRTADMTFEEFERDRTVGKAVLYDFIVIGEATRHIPAEIQLRYSQIPWRLIGDMRNVMTYEYFQVDLEIVWDGIQNDLSLLALQLQELLESDARDDQ